MKLRQANLTLQLKIHQMTNLVVGQTGFIGNSIKNFLDTSVNFIPATWDLPSIIKYVESIKNFKELKIFWSAGINGNFSTRMQIDREKELVKVFLQKVEEFKININQMNLISSAGSIYAGKNKFRIDELSNESPLSEYGKSRIEIENLFKNYSILNHIQLNIFRLTNVFGYKQKNKANSGVINNLILANLNNTPLNIFVSLYTKQDYIDVKFASKNIVQISQNRFNIRDFQPRTYILSRNQSHSIQELLSIINRITNKRTPISLQKQANQNNRNINLNFNVKNENFIQYKIAPLEFEVRKLVLELMNDKVA